MVALRWRRHEYTWLQLAAHVGAWLPLLLLIYDFLADNLTVNPIQDITFRTGKPALVLLILSLACTPLNSLFGWRWAIKLRRPLGVYAFLYALLHFLVFIGLDYGFDPDLLYGAIFEKRFALVGFAAFLILLPLALTSTKGWQRRLGKAWKQLHKLVYIAALLVIVHYVWLVKSDVREPLLYGAAVVGLLLVRLPAVKQRLRAAWQRLAPGARPGPRPVLARPERIERGERPPLSSPRTPTPSEQPE
jgi:sulfoxide reductase heme-binding subunit YedZ